MLVKERQDLLSVLSDDLHTQGWDKGNKLWFLMGNPGDEYLEYVGEFMQDPEHWMMHRAQEGQVRNTVGGICVAYESWTYPEPLRSMLTDDNPVRRSFREVLPPQRHPDRDQLRTLMLTTRDGLIMRCERYEQNELTVLEQMTDAPEKGAIGDPLVDFCRAVLGIASGPNPQTQLSLILAKSGRMEELLRRATAEEWSAKQMAVEIFKLASPEEQAELITHMPDELKEAIADADTDS